MADNLSSKKSATRALARTFVGVKKVLGVAVRRNVRNMPMAKGVV
jgi:hypothetical protein